MEQIRQSIDDSWVGAIHATRDDYSALGAAVLIDRRRLLTCAHVVRGRWDAGESLWIAFPKADDLVQRCRISSIIFAKEAVSDLALLFLDEDVPNSVTPAPLKCPKPKLLVGRSWHAFGFAGGDPIGNSSDGTVGADLSYGWVRLDVASRYNLGPGFSGTGLWSQDYDAVVGIIGQANQSGDGKAVTISFADIYLPGADLQELTQWSADEADDVALAAWGWTLDEDPQAIAHWKPRARGVTVNSEGGYRFRGRIAALTAIVSWLNQDRPVRKALVLTGSPGVGKSAVLGRIVTTSDRHVRRSLPPDDVAVRATEGSVSCAIHAKGKTAMDIAVEIARAASAQLPDELDDLPPALQSVLSDKGAYRFNVIIDALDEATSPTETRAIIKQIVLPLVETCSSVGVRVIVGTRRHDDGGDLLDRFGFAISKIDLDEAKYFDVEDLAAYSLATLKLVGDERVDSPYNSDFVAKPVATRIAELSDQNFLVAGLISRTHGMHDDVPINPADLSFTPTVDDALHTYLERIPTIDGIRASELLTALAFAESPGLTVELWRIAIEALSGASIDNEKLRRFIRSSAGNFLIEASGQGTASVYRLFHQALNDTLLDARRGISSPEMDDERNLARSWIAFGRDSGWATASPYLLQSLPAHAAVAGLIDELLTDDQYLLYADLRRLRPVSEAASTVLGRRRARLLRLTPRAVTAPPEVRAALFSVTEILENLGDGFSEFPVAAPYRAIWASARPRGERALLEGHIGDVNGLCSIGSDVNPMIVSAGDGTIRIWNLGTGQTQRVIDCDGSEAKGVTSYADNGHTLLAAACSDGAIRIWSAETGENRGAFHGHSGPVNCVCALRVDDRTMLVSAGYDRTVRIWDVASGECKILVGHTFAVNGVCTFTSNGRLMLASASGDDTIRLWDVVTGDLVSILRGHFGPVNGLCAFKFDNQIMLASAGGDDAVRIWRLDRKESWRILSAHTFAVKAIIAFEHEGDAMLASAGDNTVRLWNISTGDEQVVGSHTDKVRAVCSVVQDGRMLLASGGVDNAIRLWDVVIRRDEESAKEAPANSVVAFAMDDRTFLAVGGGDGIVRLWDTVTGDLCRTYGELGPPVFGICQFSLGRESSIIAAGSSELVFWDTGSANPLAGFDHVGLRAFAGDFSDGRLTMVTAGDDHEILVRDFPSDNDAAYCEIDSQVEALTALCLIRNPRFPDIVVAAGGGGIHAWLIERDRSVRSSRRRNYPPSFSVIDTYWSPCESIVSALCVVQLSAQTLLFGGTEDGAVVIWRLRAGTPKHQLALVRTLRGHTDAVNSICSFKSEDQVFIVSASNDRTIRIWTIDSAAPLLTIPVQYEALSVCFYDRTLYVGLSVGVIAIRPDVIEHLTHSNGYARSRIPNRNYRIADWLLDDPGA